MRLFPELTAGPPADEAFFRGAVRRASEQDWLLFSGELTVQRFFDLSTTEADESRRKGGGPRLCAVGIGAVRALRAFGAEPEAQPRVHRAPEVADSLGDVRGHRITLFRGDRVTEELPDLLRQRGADVRDVNAFGVVARGDADLRRAAFAEPVDFLLFANPAAVRIFFSTLVAENMEPERCLAGIPIAAVGPATARAMRGVGFEADLEAAGRLSDLVLALEDLLPQGE